MTINLKIKTVLLVLLSTVISSVSAAQSDAILSWVKRVELSTPVSGVVQKVFAEPGKIVARGDVLVQLDPRIFRAEYKLAKAKLDNTRAVKEEAKRELDRQQDMYDRTMLSDHDLQVAKNNFIAAEAQYHQARAALVKAKVNLEYSAIRAPFNALVISSRAVKGQVVASSMAPPVLVTVAKANRMQARLLVNESELSHYSPGQAAKVTVTGETFTGKISMISLEPLQSGKYAVDVVFDSRDRILRAGQKAQIEF